MILWLECYDSIEGQDTSNIPREFVPGEGLGSRRRLSAQGWRVGGASLGSEAAFSAWFDD